MKDARTQECPSEQLFANRVKAARAAYEGTEMTAPPTVTKEQELAEDPEDAMFGTGG